MLSVKASKQTNKQSNTLTLVYTLFCSSLPRLGWSCRISVIQQPLCRFGWIRHEVEYAPLGSVQSAGRTLFFDNRQVGRRGCVCVFRFWCIEFGANTLIHMHNSKLKFNSIKLPPQFWKNQSQSKITWTTTTTTTTTQTAAAPVQGSVVVADIDTQATFPPQSSWWLPLHRQLHPSTTTTTTRMTLIHWQPYC